MKRWTPYREIEDCITQFKRRIASHIPHIETYENACPDSPHFKDLLADKECCAVAVQALNVALHKMKKKYKKYELGKTINDMEGGE
jgi:hypothetical protein